MNIKRVREKFDCIDDSVVVDESVEGFSEDFVNDISRIFGGGN